MAVTLIEIPASVSLQGIPCRFTATSDWGNATYITLVVQELVGAVWTDAYIPDTAPIIDGAAQFDVSGFFAGQLQPDFSFPEHSSNLVLQRPGMIRAFRVKLYEPGNESNALSYGTTFYMLPGGIHFNDFANLNEVSLTWWEEHIESGRALNWMPATKNVSPDSIEKIYWIQQDSATRIIRIAWTATDGATGNYDHSQLFNAFTVYEISVSPAIVEALTGKTIASYTVEMIFTSAPSHPLDEPLSQQFTVDRQHYEWNEYFLMENDLGGFDGVWCHGAHTEKLTYERNQYQRSDLRNIGATDRILGNIRGLVNRQGESDSGYADDETREWLGALLNSDNAFRIAGLNIKPIVITSEDVDIIDELKQANEPLEVIFSWKYARPGKYGSRIKLNPAYIYPPYFSKLKAFFYKLTGATLLDKIGGLEATISGTDITFPDITGNDSFDFSDATYWDQTLIAATGWYSAGSPRTCPLSWMVGTEWAEAATATTHARLFHRDYGTKVRDIIPVLVYASSLTADEQQAVVDWLDWYATIWQDGSILTQDGTPITQ
ncbi:hypothetical protein [Mangrovibacterium sp.]|uniref:hypothetical protein n=1 Tax=Mangrovibacterium sp. TaxID=1961364 RepID=UPI0035669833